MQSSSSSTQRPRTGYGRSRSGANRNSCSSTSQLSKPAQVSSVVTYTDLSSPQNTPRQVTGRKPSGPFSPRGNLITLNTGSLVTKSTPRAKPHLPKRHSSNAGDLKGADAGRYLPPERQGVVGKRVGVTDKSATASLRNTDAAHPVDAEQPAVSRDKENSRCETPVRPKSSYGRRSTPASAVSRTVIQAEGQPIERPKTGHGRKRPESHLGQVHPDYLEAARRSVNSTYSHQEKLETTGPQNDEGYSRPVTSRGRRSIDLTAFQTTPRRDSVELERPKTRRGTRILQSPSSDPWTSDTLYKSLDGSVSAREPLSQGTFVDGPALEEAASPSQAPGEVNILKLDTGEELVDEEDEFNINNNAGTEHMKNEVMYETTDFTDANSHHRRPQHPNKSRQLQSASKNIPQRPITMTTDMYTDRTRTMSHHDPASTETIPQSHESSGPFLPTGPPPGQPTRPRSSRYRRISRDYVDLVRTPTLSRSSTPEVLSSLHVLPPIGSSLPPSPQQQAGTPVLIPISSDTHQLSPQADPTTPNLALLTLDDAEHQSPAAEDLPSPDGYTTFHPLVREVELPREPSSAEPSVHLGIKLPSGLRVQRRFSALDPLQAVLSFAEISAHLDFSGCLLVSTVPRVEYSDMSSTLEEAKLEDKMILHVEIPDEG